MFNFIQERPSGKDHGLAEGRRDQPGQEGSQRADLPEVQRDRQVLARDGHPLVHQEHQDLLGEGDHQVVQEVQDSLSEGRDEP